MPEVACNYCQRKILRAQNRINENKRLGHHFYCSNSCQGSVLRKRSTFICENKICGKEFEKLRKEIGAHNYCSRNCAVIVNNKRFPKHTLKLKSCGICNGRFNGSNTYCSTTCYGASRIRYRPEELLKSLKNAYTKLGRVPAKREVYTLARACTYAFGSWNNAVTAAGLTPNRSHDHRMYKRIMTKAKDGHSCDSISEAIIDNWLTDNKIEHQRDAVYPSSNHKADWAVGKRTFIEYFGLAKDSPRYDRDIKTKRKLCVLHGIKLLEIYPADLYPKLNLALKLKNVR